MAGHDEVAEGWHKSSFSPAADCVEVRVEPDRVHVRNSKNPQGSILTFTRTEWQAFLRGVHGGEFELPASRTP